MGMLDTEATALDVFGLPGFFATDFIAEPIGNGCVRLFGGVMQRGIFVPQYYVNSPHQCILKGATGAMETAMAVSLQIQRAVARAAH